MRLQSNEKTEKQVVDSLLSCFIFRLTFKSPTMKWDNAQNYHLCLESGELDIEKCVEIIKCLY